MVPQFGGGPRCRMIYPQQRTKPTPNIRQPGVRAPSPIVLPPPLLFISAAPSSAAVAGPRALAREISVCVVTVTDETWRVASGSIRVASFPRLDERNPFFARSVWSVWGGKKKRNWIVSSLISGSSWISVWVILYVYIRSCIGGLDLGCWVWNNWGRLDLCKMITGRSDI